MHFSFLHILLVFNLFQTENTQIKFDFYWGNEVFELEKPFLLANDTVYFSKLQFYVSNIHFLQKKNKKISQTTPKLISFDTEKSQNIIALPKKINLQNLENIIFSIGLDENTNTSQNPQKLDLDPQKGMFWTWESGYIFWKMEGYFFEKNNQKKGIIYHLGRKECYQTINIKIENVEKYFSNNIIHIKFDVQKIWEHQSLKSYPNSVMIGESATKIAQKIKNIFQEINEKQ